MVAGAIRSASLLGGPDLMRETEVEAVEAELLWESNTATARPIAVSPVNNRVIPKICKRGSVRNSVHNSERSCGVNTYKPCSLDLLCV